MSEDNPYRVFVTHLFEDNEDYQRVFEYLQSRDNFFYVNFSKPENMPAAGGPQAVKDELKDQITAAEVMLMPVAMFELNPDLIRYQTDVAKANNIGIVGLKSFGETMAIRKDVLDLCNDIVDWNDRTMINAIKLHGRNEATSEWEVVEFDLD